VLGSAQCASCRDMVEFVMNTATGPLDLRAASSSSERRWKQGGGGAKEGVGEEAQRMVPAKQQRHPVGYKGRLSYSQPRVGCPGGDTRLNL